MERIAGKMFRARSSIRAVVTSVLSSVGPLVKKTATFLIVSPARTRLKTLRPTKSMLAPSWRRSVALSRVMFFTDSINSLLWRQISKRIRYWVEELYPTTATRAPVGQLLSVRARSSSRERRAERCLSKIAGVTSADMSRENTSSRGVAGHWGRPGGGNV